MSAGFDENDNTNGKGRRRYRFKDCLEGDFARPRSKKESLAFDALFVLGMATTMVLIVNFAIRPLATGVHETALAAFIESIKILPALCVAALLSRLIYADRVSMLIMRKVIAPRFKGVRASVLTVGVNVLLMAPAMCACAVLISGAPPVAILQAFRTVFPYAAMTGFILSMVLVRPLVMMIFSNVLVPKYRHEADC